MAGKPKENAQFSCLVANGPHASRRRRVARSRPIVAGFLALGVAIGSLTVTLAPRRSQASVLSRVPGKGRTVVKHAPTTALGVDVYWAKGWPFNTTATETKEAESIVHYCKTVLHANSIAVSFPILVDLDNPEVAYTNAETPTRSDLHILISKASAAGLSVVLRPLIHVNASHFYWRGTIKPKNRDEFFRSYAHVLAPYLSLAQASHESTFVYASEFSAMATTQPATWAYLLRLMEKQFHGKLVYDALGSQYLRRVDVVPGGNDATDAYFAVPTGPTASVGRLISGWHGIFRKVPKTTIENTVLYEVGFDAEATGYKIPYKITNPPDTQMKYLFMGNRWFTMVCQIVHDFHMAGVYFWSLNFNVNPATAVGTSRLMSSTSWVARPGAQAIASCFRNFQAAGKKKKAKK